MSKVHMSSKQLRTFAETILDSLESVTDKIAEAESYLNQAGDILGNNVDDEPSADIDYDAQADSASDYANDETTANDDEYTYDEASDDSYVEGPASDTGDDDGFEGADTDADDEDGFEGESYDDEPEAENDEGLAAEDESDDDAESTEFSVNRGKMATFSVSKQDEKRYKAVKDFLNMSL